MERDTSKSQQTATSPTDKLPAFCSCLTLHDELASVPSASQVDSYVFFHQISSCELRQVQVLVCALLQAWLSLKGTKI